MLSARGSSVCVWSAVHRLIIFRIRTHISPRSSFFFSVSISLPTAAVVAYPAAGSVIYGRPNIVARTSVLGKFPFYQLKSVWHRVLNNFVPFVSLTALLVVQLTIR